MSAPRNKGAKLARKFARNTEPAVLVRYLRFNLLVGAASADATPEQRDRLKQIPELVRRGAELDKLGALVFDIMGPDWMPGPDWVAQIDALSTGGST